MITKISLRAITSYSSVADTFLETEKKINLLYGQNGTGKSTISNFLQTPSELDYISCALTVSGEQPEIVVYNQKFIEANFYEGSQPGVFTLSETNKEAEIAIEASQKKILELQVKQEAIKSQGIKLKSEQSQELLALKELVWEAKAKYERSALEFCLERFKANKDKFLEQVKSSLQSENAEIVETDLIVEATELRDRTDIEKAVLPQINFEQSFVEKNKIFREVIVGSADSYLSQLIQVLKNSDWVKSGLQYVNEKNDDCPFCQQKMPEAFSRAIQLLFDETYEGKIGELRKYAAIYQSSATELFARLDTAIFKNEYVLENEKFELCKVNLINSINSNIQLIQNKISSPSTPVQLEDTSQYLLALRDCLAEVAQKIVEFNERVRNKKTHLQKINTSFWQLLAARYSSAIALTDQKLFKLEEQLIEKRAELAKINAEIAEQKTYITENQAKVTNIDLSIERINATIGNLGLQGFSLEKEGDGSSRYRIARTDSAKKVYESLSEGEKTLITFLYFLECCKGSRDKQSAVVLSNRIVVIDDPISSLSHNYVYDIAMLIQRRIVEAGFRQIFILTHNLFFFHELIKLKNYVEDKSLKKNYAFFRVGKNIFSSISPMRESDVLNDYQSYWEVLKDCLAGKVGAIVLPNMMRNILEYYFNFVHKQDSLQKALAKLSDTEVEFKTLYRYINRQSHADGININDFGAIDPIRYLEKFRLVFQETGFEHHYDRMMGIDALEQ